MNPKLKKILSALLILAVLATLSYFGVDLASPSLEESSGTTLSTTLPQESQTTAPTQEADGQLDPEGFYYSKEDVALFIHSYGRLPDNFVTKSEATEQFGGSKTAMKECYRIGGDRFGNREGRLPKKDGRTWTECDIVAQGVTNRGAKRIVFSNDGLVYYTDDHYESFTLLYGEP